MQSLISPDNIGPGEIIVKIVKSSTNSKSITICDALLRFLDLQGYNQFSSGNMSSPSAFVLTNVEGEGHNWRRRFPIPLLTPWQNLLLNRRRSDVSFLVMVTHLLILTFFLYSNYYLHPCSTLPILFFRIHLAQGASHLVVLASGWDLLNGSSQNWFPSPIDVHS